MMLAEQRAHLTDLLLQLMEQRDIRAKEIAKRMVCSIVVYPLFDVKCCEIPNDACTLLSQNLIGYSTLFQEY